MTEETIPPAPEVPTTESKSTRRRRRPTREEEMEAIKAAEAGTTAPKPAEPAPPAETVAKAKAKLGRFRAKRVPIHNAYQNVTVPVTHGVPMEMDNWVEVQVAAGVIEEVD